MTTEYDAIVVGSGPNGLVAGLALARRGLSVLMLEAGATPGGGCRTEELTLPGFRHDVCSAIHPMAVMSPAFRKLDLAKLGVELIYSDYAVAHPLPSGEVALLERSIEATAKNLGEDGAAWEKLMRPFASLDFFESILGPAWVPKGDPIRKIRFGLSAIRSSDALVNARFRGEKARALFGGCAGHSVVALDRAGTASFGLALALSGHVAGWPLVRGGSVKIADALLGEFLKRGGEIQLNRRVASLKELPGARAVLFDLSPRQIAAICGEALPENFRERYADFKQGPGIFKVDYALAGPVPWRNPECLRSATVHVVGTYEELARAEHAAFNGSVPEKPFVLFVQQSLFDSTRAPRGKHTGWAYCHVPNGCAVDMTERIEAQIERFAPGFRDLILARRTASPAQVEQHNPTMIGGDIAGGSNEFWKFMFRPAARWNPYTTPNEQIFICSSSTPPGGGVHGMCGFLAAEAAIRKHFS